MALFSILVLCYNANMLTYYWKKLQENLIIKKLTNFFHSYYYIIVIALLALISEIFGLELIIYSIVLVFVLLGLLFSDDGTHLIAPLFFMYVSVSKKNVWVNETFDDPNAWQSNLLFTKYNTIFIILVSIIAAIVITQFVFSIIRKKVIKRPKMLVGFILLGMGYILGGLFSPYYSVNTVLFGLLEFSSLFIPYLIVLFTVDFDKMKEGYVGIIFISLGFVVLGQIINAYREAFIVLKQAEEIDYFAIDIRTGWGITNNLGCEMLFAFIGMIYFIITKERYAFLYVIIQMLFGIGVVLSQSRGAFFVMGIALVCSIFIGTLCAKKSSKIEVGMTYVTMLLLVLIMMIAFRDTLTNVFISKIAKFAATTADEASSGRIRIWSDAINNEFKPYPFFGTGFLRAKEYVRTRSLLTARYHNTTVQLLASTGIIGFNLAYYHRLESFWVSVKKWNPVSIIVGGFILAMLAVSQIDCHYFNIGPGIQYGIILAFGEGINYLKKAQ